MTIAPTLVAAYGATTSDSNISPQTASVTVSAGEMLVVVALQASNTRVLTTPTGGTGLTWTLQTSQTGGSNASSWIWTTVSPTTQTFTLSITQSPSGGAWAFDVYRFSGHGGIGSVNSATNGTVTGTATLGLTTTAADSAIVMGIADSPAAINGSGRVYNTATAGAFTERLYYLNSGNDTMYSGYYADAGTAGAKTVGLTAPAGQRYTISAVEVLPLTTGTTKITTAETGTAGASVVQGTSVGGDVIDLISKSAGGSITIDNTSGRQAHGVNSLRFITAATTDTSILGFNFADSQKTAAMQFYYRMDALPAAGVSICQIRNASANLASVVLNANGSATVSFTGGSGTASAAALLSAGNVYRFGLYINLGTTGTSDSTVTWAVYLGDNTSPLYTYTTTTASLGTSTVASCRIGKVSGSEATTAAWNYDDFRATTGATGLLSPEAVANVAPTANAGADQVNIEPGSIVTISGSASSDPDGTIATFAWVQTAGTPTVTLSGTGAARTFPAPLTLTGTTLTFGLTVTDNNGATSAQDTMTVAVLACSERVAIGGVWVAAKISIM